MGVGGQDLAAKSFNISQAEAGSPNVAALSVKADFEGIDNYGGALRRLFYLKYLSSPKEDLLLALQVTNHRRSVSWSGSGLVSPPTCRYLRDSLPFTQPRVGPY